MSWQRRLAALAVVAATASACSGDPAEPTPELGAEATTTTTLVDDSTTTTAIEGTDRPTTETTDAPSDVAPETLAFSSSSDLGRLFEVSGSVQPADAAGSDELGETIFDGTLVQATNLRSRSGVIWVRINSTEDANDVLGWVTADDLRPTTQTVERFDENRTTEFRQVSRVVEDDLLEVLTAPGDGSTVATLIETEVAMHGGNSVLLPSGETWVDVVDSSTLQRRGWVPAASFRTLGSIEAKAPDGVDVARRADRDESYGGGIGTGVVSAVGCNAQQITFTGSSSTLGSAVVFGNVPPVGTPLDSSNTRFRWSSSGGSTVYLEPGQTVTFTFPSQGTKNWYFTTLGTDGEAAHVKVGGVAQLDASGRATATEVQEFRVPAGSCAPSELLEPQLDPYIYDLPEDEREEALAAFEEELAAFEAAGGTVTEENASEDVEAAVEGDQTVAPPPGSQVDDGTPNALDPQEGSGTPVEPADESDADGSGEGA